MTPATPAQKAARDELTEAQAESDLALAEIRRVGLKIGAALARYKLACARVDAAQREIDRMRAEG